MLSLFLLMIDVGRQDFTTCLPILPPSSIRDGPECPVNTPGGLLTMDRRYQCWGLRKRWYLVHITMGCGHGSPRAPDIATQPRVHA
jgi:hypothetical protein